MMKQKSRLTILLITGVLICAIVITGCAQSVQAPTDSPQEAMIDTSPEYAATEDYAYAEPLYDDETYEPEYRYPSSSEEYGSYSESPFYSPTEKPLSTFSVDVDTASYSRVRRYIGDGMLPPTDAVRVEEFVNYFSYDYSAPKGDVPVNVGVTISDCPWQQGRYLARVAVKARELNLSEAPDSNLVFLIDVSGSMNSQDRLPLVKSALLMLAENLNDDDTVSIVVYAGASGLVLDGCKATDKASIESAIMRLSAGGSTAGGAGIELAYNTAARHFIEGGNNRVILCTDGDFNVGPSSVGDLETLIERKRDTGVFLSVLGFGMGNLKDNLMETLSDKGNGNYAYIDTLMEAKKVLVNEAASTLYTIAKDVKIQIEFNPKAVKQYRLVGYDNRLLNPEDFNDDKKDAGEMGAGHCVTAFYELILTDSPGEKDVDALVFQEEPAVAVMAQPADDWLYVKLRYKQPDSALSQLINVMAGKNNYIKIPDSDFVFASAVAECALLLKNSEYKGNASYSGLIERARAARGIDPDGLRAQFIELADTARLLR